MKPLLKSYVVYVQVEEGVYFEAGQESFLFKGRGLFPLVTRIVSLLDGTRTLAAIESIVPEKAHTLLGLLLGELEQRRMLHMVIDTLEAHLPKHVELLYSGTIGFLKDQTPHWSAVFQRWRERKIIVAGAGLSYRVLVRNLMRSGARHLVLALDQSEDPSGDQAAITEFVAEAKSRDAEIVVDWVDAAQAIEAAGADDARILYVSDAVPLREDGLFHRLTAWDRPDTLAGGVYRGAALVGPQSGEGISLLPIWDRIAVKLAGPPYSRAARATLGSVVAFEALKSLAIEESPNRNAVIGCAGTATMCGPTPRPRFTSSFPSLPRRQAARHRPRPPIPGPMTSRCSIRWRDACNGRILPERSFHCRIARYG